MLIEDVKKEISTIRLTFDEIMIINNTLNEVCHGVDIPDFSTRIGAEIDDVKNLLHLIHNLYNQMWQMQDEYSENPKNPAAMSRRS